jgi:cobalt-zinc-cadmium resistance protein CzcA
MLNKIIEFSTKNKLIIGLFVIALIGYGSFQFTKLPIDAVPDITDNQVQVITIAPSLGAPDVERLITFPIEQANSNIPGIKEMRSFSRFGLSLITVVFEDDVDLYWARQQISERLKIAEQQIPEGLGLPELAPVTTGLGEIYQYVLKPKKGYETKFDATELRTIQDWIVRRQLLGVKGVADVSSFGGLLKQYEIAVNPQKLNALGVTINDLFVALEKNNENTGGSYIEKASTVLYIRSEGLIGTINDIENIVVKVTSNGTPLLVRDVAEVKIGSATRYGALTYNNDGEVAGGVVMMLKGENSNSVIEAVKDKVALIKNTLPEGVEMEAFLDRSKMVNSAIGTVSKNLLEGALIVIFVLVVFLGNFRAGFLVASVIPLSMLFAIVMMNLFGVSGNLMSLGALDFGLIVDGAVIIVESVMHGLTLNKNKHSLNKLSQPEMDKVVTKSASQMMNSAVFGQIIILVVYLPIFTLEGIEGKMFKPMAQTVAFALLGAFLLSLTYIPMMSALFLSKNTEHKRNWSDRMMDFLVGIHQKYLSKLLRFPKTVIAFSLGLFAISILLLSRMGGEFIPELPEGDFAVETRVLTGSSITTTKEACMKGAKILKDQFPEVEKVVSKIGSGEIPTDPMPMDAGDMMVILKDKSEWTSANTWDELSEKMSNALKDIPGVSYSFQYPVAMRFNELMTGAKQDIVCKIFGENLDTLSKYSKLLGHLATPIEGVENIYVEPIDGQAQLIIKYNRQALASFGLNIKDINQILNAAFAGQHSGLVYEDEKRFDLVVRLNSENRQNIEDVQNLLIPTSQGTQIPLYQVAEISIKESVNQIQREDAKRRIIVGFNAKGRDVQSLVNELKTKVESQLKLPSGYFITYGGAFENLVAAKQRLSLAVPVSLLLIFVFLYFAFNSVKQGLLIYSAIPLSAIGGVLLLSIRDMPFSISAGVGFIALFGVAVLNGIVLLAEFNRIKAAGETNPMTIILNGTKNRLRPVLMTAFVASFGFLPMALSHGSGAEVQRPLATVVIGGLLIATFLTLFVLPVLYLIFNKDDKMKNQTNLSKSALLILLISSFSLAQAQPNIDLQSALDSALKNNLLLKNEQLNAEYQRMLIKTSIEIPQANLVTEYGQINSYYSDNKIGLEQSISFPSIYNKQKSIKNEQYKNSLFNVNLKEIELKKQVRESYFSLLNLYEKKKILEQTDSLYGEYLKKVLLQFTEGDVNLLEKTSAELQRGQISTQLNSLKNDIEINQLQFQLLINTRLFYQPIKSEFKIEETVDILNKNINSHPLYLILNQQKNISLLNTQLEKNKLLPNLNVGYYSMSMRGVGADNRLYGSSTRFNSVQFGVGVPLFFGSQKGKISAAKSLEQLADNSLNAGMQSLHNQIDIAYKTYQTALENVNYYETNALKNTDIILKSAQQQFENGNINYLEWMMLINNATLVKSQYTDALTALNKSMIQLYYLNSK